MRLIDADRLCEDLLNRWSIADSRKEELIRQVMADIVTPIVVSQPTANQWIPCSERLPDVAQRVLLSGHGKVMVGRLHSFGKYSLEPTGISYIYPMDAIDAWMPLPEPYEGKNQ